MTGEGHEATRPPPGTEPPAGTPVRRGPLETAGDAFRAAPATTALVTLTVAVWIAHLVLLRLAQVNTDISLGDPGTAIHGDWWRLVTPLVVHFGILHIALNMVVLARLGPPVERLVGSWRFTAVYVLSGIGGQVASDLVVGHNALSGGASGAIYGVIGILAGLAVADYVAARSGARTQPTVNPAAVKSLTIQAGLWLLVGGAVAHVDSAAHAGGAVVGVIAGMALRPRRPPTGA